MMLHTRCLCEVIEPMLMFVWIRPSQAENQPESAELKGNDYLQQLPVLLERFLCLLIARSECQVSEINMPNTYTKFIVKFWKL